MARIRSVFPGLFTDEAFMDLTPMARLLVIGLWTESWDDGVFEWKPRVLKARLFPADNVDLVPLLDELVRFDVVRKVERSGSDYGLIRNFVRYQRPRKPNSSGVTTPDDRHYLGFRGDPDGGPMSFEGRTDADSVSHESEPDEDRGAEAGGRCGTGTEPALVEGGGSAALRTVEAARVPYQCRTSTEPVPHQCGTGTGIGQQMERRGGEDGEEDGENPSTQRIVAERARPRPGVWDREAYADLERRLREAAGFEANPAAGLAMVGPIVELIGEGFDLDAEILPVIRGKATGLSKQVSSWRFFVAAIREARDRGRSGSPSGFRSVGDVVAEAKRRLGGRAR